MILFFSFCQNLFRRIVVEFHEHIKNPEAKESLVCEFTYSHHVTN